MRASRIVLSVLLLLATPTALYAESNAAQARRLYQSGAKHFDLGEYQQALSEFKAAYLAKNDPLLLYNIAQCQRLLGQRQDAVHSYEAYLRRAKNAPNRDEVEAKIAALEAAAPAAVPSPAASPLPSEPSTMASSNLASAPAPSPNDAARLTAPAPQKKPLYKRWWLWTAVGGTVAAGLAVGLAVGLRSSGPPTFPAVGL